MTVSREYTDYIRELFAPLGPIHVKRMFGGAGVYQGELMFGFIADDSLYLRVDNETEPAFRAEACEPFTFRMKDGREVEISYWRAPESALDNPEDALPWARLSLEAAMRKAAAKGKRRTR